MESVSSTTEQCSKTWIATFIAFQVFEHCLSICFDISIVIDNPFTLVSRCHEIVENITNDSFSLSTLSSVVVSNGILLILFFARLQRIKVQSHWILAHSMLLHTTTSMCVLQANFIIVWYCYFPSGWLPYVSLLRKMRYNIWVVMR